MYEIVAARSSPPVGGELSSFEKASQGQPDRGPGEFLMLLNSAVPR